MLYGEGVIGLVVLVFWIWAIFDVIGTPSDRCRNLPKFVWLVLVIALSEVGALAWLLMGRPPRGSVTQDDAPRRPRRARSYALEDSPRWRPRADSTGGPSEPERGDLDEARRAWLARMDAELDQRIEQRMASEADPATHGDDGAADRHGSPEERKASPPGDKGEP